MQDEYVKLEKGTVQVTRTGYGPTPLVLLSGFSTLFPGLEYGALGTELAKKFPVLIPSKFGYGYSDLTDAPRDADAIVEEYRAVLSALKVPTPVVLCAHSMGFLEALRWAQKYPEEVAALVGLDPATPEVYQTFDLTGSQARLEKINRPEWKRRLTFRLMASSMLSRYPANLRRKLAPAARRNFACLTWVNESRALPENVRTISRAGAPANIPALFLLSNGKGTPLPGEEWRKHALSYLEHFESRQYELFDLPHDLYYYQPQELAEVILDFLAQVQDGALEKGGAEEPEQKLASVQPGDRPYVPVPAITCSAKSGAAPKPHRHQF